MAKLGIDLGTANSAAAVVFDIDKKPVTIEPSEGLPYYSTDLVFPSYVAFNKEGEAPVAGLPAWERLPTVQYALVVRYFKRLIGRPYDYVIERISKGDRAFSEFQGRIKRSNDGFILITVGGRDISVVEVASHLLKKIVDDAQIFIKNRGETIDSVTMSVPTGLDSSQRQATIEAAELAGLKGMNIQLIEEPTAAAIARGSGNIEGKIMVINVGAGTTDVIIGYIDATNESLQLTMPSQDCDDLLGGIDMDELILKYVLKNDTGLPKLEDILAGLDMVQRLRLMRKIEEAKIVAENDGNAPISIRLKISETESKQINIPLDRATLSNIVAPIINGYEIKDNRLKGVRPVVERALFKAAGGNLNAVPKVIDEIQWLILIGGPCRMKCLHEMLKDVFKDNKRVLTQLDNINPTARFIKEGVAQGAALSQVKGIHVSTSVPWTVSIFHQSGATPIIAAGTPYTSGQGTNKSALIPVHQGSNQLWILSQKESKQSIREGSMYSHIVNVPQDGNLKVNLKWDVGGVETDKFSVEGCGLPGSIEFPQVEATTLGKVLEGRYEWYLGIAKDLRQLIGLAREPLVRLLVSKGWAVSEAESRTAEWLRVSDFDLRQSDVIDVGAEKELTDEDIEIAVKAGYFEMRKQVAIERNLFSTQSAEVLDKVLSLLLKQTPASIEELIDEANKFLNSSRNCSPCIQFWQQLTQWLHRLELAPGDHTVASATTTALGALADCLHNQKVISEEDFSHVQDVCWRFYRER